MKYCWAHFSPVQIFLSGVIGLSIPRSTGVLIFFLVVYQCAFVTILREKKSEENKIGKETKLLVCKNSYLNLNCDLINAIYV